MLKGSIVRGHGRLTARRRLDSRIIAAIVVAIVIATAGAAQNQQPVIRTPPPMVSPGWYDWINSPGVPAAARAQLEPLYQELDWLQRVRVPAALLQFQDTAWDMLSVLGAQTNSQAADVVAKSLDRPTPLRPSGANSPATAEGEGRDIASAIRDREARIRAIRHQFNIDATIGPASKPIDLSSLFSRPELEKWLAKSDVGLKVLKAEPQATRPIVRSASQCYAEFRQCSEVECRGYFARTGVEEGVCVTECEVKQSECNGQAPSPQKLRYIGVMTALAQCSRDSMACFKGCGSRPDCVNACSKTADDCRTRAQQIP